MKADYDSLLFPHEWEALKNALHRDISDELEKAGNSKSDAAQHAYNARMSQRILEAFSPSSPAAPE